MDTYLIVALVIVSALLLVAWLRIRRPRRGSAGAEAERLDTLIGWPPEATRIMRTPERLALSTLKLALPGYMIFAQVPIARFVNVPKRNSYAEWMRRIGSQCVDFVVCDMTSQVVAAIDVRRPEPQVSDRVRRRTERLARTLRAVGITLHVWNEESLPSVESARTTLLPHLPAAVPAEVVAQKTAARASAVLAQARQPFEDTDRPDHRIEVTEMAEPSASTWFDELDSVPSTLPPPSARHDR